MSISMQIRQQGDVLIARLGGELDHHTADKVKGHLEQQLAKGHTKHLVVNLAGMHFMDSSGLGVLIGRYKQIKQLGGQMKVSNVDPAIYRIIEMSGLFKIIQVHPTEHEALSGLEVE
jgi:stage II sporulation protein AA (anti-sigma F factor antagonist)